MVKLIVFGQGHVEDSAGTQKIPKRGFLTREVGLSPMDKLEEVQDEPVS
jgi:hypothetical protein